ncbi:hypothetical protein BGZ89_009576 [Linnemannia elongata]|nr:hypothetical protein BGZ89_009576 [Linnemannia elongata]
MFQCPMEKCPKSFARAYNLHIHLKTQHHLASKELAAVSPLRAPPSAPPVQIITPEEVAARTTTSDKDQSSTVHMISGCYDASTGDGVENGSLDCDSSCVSLPQGGTAACGQGRSFACHLCPRIFSRKHDLHRHIRVHTGSKPYLCTNCHKAFARTDALCRHYKVEDDCRQVLIEVEAASTMTMTESEERAAN